jgi:hypothetical protein
MAFSCRFIMSISHVAVVVLGPPTHPPGISASKSVTTVQWVHSLVSFFRRTSLLQQWNNRTHRYSSTVGDTDQA